MARRSAARLVCVAAAVALVAALAAPAAAQDVAAAGEAAGPRPLPDSVVPVPGYRAAVEAGTRSDDGAPGPGYWQQWTEYDLSARVDVAARELEGTATIGYHNRSPDTLEVLYLHLHQNLHAPGAVRNEPQEVTGGVRLERVAVDGVELRPAGEGAGGAGAGPGGGAAYRVQATVARLEPPAPVPPGGRAEIEVAWSFRVPRSGAGRMGRDGDDLFFLGYWYPQMAVYDDVVGWHTDPYLGRGEFYMGYGSYDVTLDVPEGWVIRATGSLRNPGQVLPADVRRRLESAGTGDSVVHVLTEEDLPSVGRAGEGGPEGAAEAPGPEGAAAAEGAAGPGGATLDAPDDRLTWRFVADSVRDFAFSATRRHLWDAARTPVGDRDGDGSVDHTRVEALYRPGASRWTETWRYARHAIDFLSRATGLPYPWPHMTAVEGGGIIGGGMEYPMMTLVGDYQARGDSALYYVTAHELAHMWIPMVVGTDEKRYAWMDEGTVTFLENQARKEFFPGRDHDVPDREDYVEVARRGEEVPVMTWMDYQYPPAGNAPNYDKPASVLVALEAVLGPATVREALATFVSEWAYRHPYPWDFFRTVERVAGRSLDWFWRTWYYETWGLDHAVADVDQSASGAEITVEDRGWAVMPILLEVTLEDGLELRRRVDIGPWLKGERSRTVTVTAGSPVVKVEIDPQGQLPDVDRSNNVWPREEEGEQ